MFRKLFLSLLFISCLSSIFSQTFSDEGLNLFWSISNKLQKEEQVKISEWKTLWEAPGYSSWMGSKRAQDIFKNYFTLVYNPALEDSLNQEIIRSTGFRLVIFSHLEEAKAKQAEIKEFVRTLIASNIIAKANKQARKYLPKGFKAKNEKAIIALMLFQPDAYALAEDPIIIMDALYAYNYGSGFEKFLGHELHHIYNEAYFSKLVDVGNDDPYYPILWSISKLKLEGIADLIDKNDILSKKDLSEYESKYITIYHESKHHLRRIDSLIQSISLDTSLLKVNGKLIMAELPYGAHPTGLYMAHIIKSKFGKKGIINCLDNPFTFIDSYNKAALLAPEKYHVFSTATMTYLLQLEKKFISENTLSQVKKVNE